MKLLLTILFVLILAGCGKKPIQETTTTTIKDSTIVETETRIDTITTPGDTIEFEVKIDCDSVTNEPKAIDYKAEGDRSSVSLEIDSSGNLEGQAGCDSLRQEVKLKDKKITRLRSETTVTRKEVPVQYVAWYHKAAMWLSGGLLALIVIVVLVKAFLGSIIPW